MSLCLQKFIQDALSKPVDVLIATPQSLLKYRQQEHILLSDISHLVLDEADTLLDDSFREATTSIVRAIRVRGIKPPALPARAEGAQVTLVGATLNDDMLGRVEKLVPVSGCWVNFLWQHKSFSECEESVKQTFASGATSCRTEVHQNCTA